MLLYFQSIVHKYLAKQGSLAVDTFDLLCLEFLGQLMTSMNQYELGPVLVTHLSQLDPIWQADDWCVTAFLWGTWARYGAEMVQGWKHHSKDRKQAYLLGRNLDLFVRESFDIESKLLSKFG